MELQLNVLIFFTQYAPLKSKLYVVLKKFRLFDSKYFFPSCSVDNSVLLHVLLPSMHMKKKPY